MPITLDGAEVQVTKNLFAALKYIRWGPLKPEMYTWNLLWIDAVCINQKDETEIGAQVQLMGQIYSRAQEVLGWLGEGVTLNSGFYYFVELWAEVFDSGSEEESIKQLFTDPGFQYMYLREEEWTAVSKVFEEPFWKRRWILQEMVLSKNPSLLLADHVHLKVDFKKLVDALENWTKIRDSKWERLTKSFPWIRSIPLETAGTYPVLRKWHASIASRPDMLKLLKACQRMEVGNSRDQFYAIRSLATDGHMIIPDYRRPAEEIFYDFACYIIRSQGNLNILGHAGLTSITSRSWIPDWKYRDDIPNLSSIYSAGTDLREVFDINRSRLRVRGVTCGMMIQTFPAEKLYEDPRSLLPFQVDPLTECYPGKVPIPILQAYFRTILLDHDPVTNERLSPTTKSFWDLAAGFFAFLRYACSPRQQSGIQLLSSLIIDYEIVPESPSLIPDHLRFFLRWLQWPESLFEDQSSMEKVLELFCGLEGTDGALVWPRIDNIDRGSDNLRLFYRSAMEKLKNKTFFHLPHGLFGIGPRDQELWDSVSLIAGCDVPLVLRTQVTGGTKVVGPCFVLGTMDGGMQKHVDSGNLDFETIYLV